MVIGLFPLAKLGTLFIKQITKPIAEMVKKQAVQHHFVRRWICIPPAQLYHWSEVKMKMWILNLGKPVNIPVLNEQQAIELGANLLGEGVIFTIAALILINEYQRSSAKEAKKEAATKAEKQVLEQNIHDLYFITQKQATQINELMRHIYDLEGRVVQVPWKSKNTFWR
ncbi:putative OPA3-like protein CG13603 isoform X1 [Atheta coriaria]|uniref:putative OPA3-like protein CG13603 isoform X1 n=1 Tax=Dalotia coriaria TaxID=877792 RepID=UPI0031F3E0FC